VCPQDLVSPTKNVVCRNVSGVCDIAEYCDGLSPFCPSNVFRNSSEPCLPAIGQCGLQQYCTGMEPVCPDRVFGECVGGATCNTQTGICICANNKTGYPYCEDFCGDKICNQKGAENCVNCPVDCPAPCDLCGDGVCLVRNEGCDSCYEDCAQIACTGRTCPQCLNGGQCLRTEGRCSCLGNYFGPTCAHNTLRIDRVLPQGASPTIIVTVSSPSTNIKKQFMIALIAIAEEDSNNNVVRSIDLSSTVFQVDYVSSATFQKWTFTADIARYGQISVHFTHAAANLVRAARATAQKVNTIQMEVEFHSWVFTSATSTLQIVGENSVISHSIDNCNIETNKDSDSVEWFMLHSSDDIALYYELPLYAQLDGRTRYARNDMLPADANFVTRIPFFWYNTSLSTTFGFLPDFNYTGCNDRPHGDEDGKYDWAIFLIIPIVILFLVIICLVIMFVLKPSRLTKCFKAGCFKCLRRRRMVHTDTKHPMMSSVGSEMVILPPSSPPPLASPPPSDVPPPSWHGSTSNLPPSDPSYPPPSGHMSMQYPPPPNHTYRPHQSSPYPQHQQYYQHDHQQQFIAHEPGQQQYNDHEPAPSAPLPTPDKMHHINGD
jgi:hypothetical protein